MLSSASGNTTSDFFWAGARRPDVEVPERRVREARGLPEPGMAVRRVVDDQIHDDPQPAVLRRADHRDEVAERAEPVVDAVVVGDVVAVVAVRRRVERHQPDAAHADAGEVVDALDKPGQVAPARRRSSRGRSRRRGSRSPRSSTTGRSFATSSRRHLRQHALTEHVDEPLLLGARHGAGRSARARARRSGRATSRASRIRRRPSRARTASRGARAGRRRRTASGSSSSQARSAPKHVRAPLIVRDRERRPRRFGPREMHLDGDRLALAAALTERVDDAPQHVARAGSR